jgi:hypothetical protein
VRAAGRLKDTGQGALEQHSGAGLGNGRRPRFIPGTQKNSPAKVGKGARSRGRNESSVPPRTYAVPGAVLSHGLSVAGDFRLAAVQDLASIRTSRQRFRKAG